MKWNEFIVTGDPMILGAQISIVLASVGIVVLLTYTKKWKWLMKEWISSVDHKKIGIMYLLAAVLMFFPRRCGCTDDAYSASITRYEIFGCTTLQ